MEGFERRTKTSGDTTNRKWKKVSWRVSGIWSRKFYDTKDLKKKKANLN